MERFTQRARRVLSRAQEEADRLGTREIDTEHMLLGMVRDRGGTAAQVLHNLGIERFQIEALIKESTESRGKAAGHAIELSAGSKKMLELAVDEARRLGHTAVGSEHLLRGMLRLEDGTAIDILHELGLNREDIRKEIVAVLSEHRPTTIIHREPQTIPSHSPGDTEFLLMRISARSGRIIHFTIDMSQSLKEALEAALQELHINEGMYLHERQVLLGLLQDSEGAVSRALLDAGVDREELIRRLRNAADY